MDENLIMMQFDKLNKAIELLFTKTQLNSSALEKLKLEFYQNSDEIKNLLSRNKIKTIPFERKAISLASICQRIYFATENQINQTDFEDQSDIICSFFSCINCPIDLYSQNLFLKENGANENESINVINADYENTVIFDSNP